MRPAVSNDILISSCPFHEGVNSLPVEILTDENDLYHPVAIPGIPVTAEGLVGLKEILKPLLWHGGIPEPGFLYGLLPPGLLKEIALVLLVIEVAKTLGTDYPGWPPLGHHIIQLIEIQGFPAIVNIRTYPVFLGLAFVVVVMVMVL